MGEPESLDAPGQEETGAAVFLKAFYEIWITERPTQYAAALAYYAIFSFVPVIYIAFTLADLFVVQLAVADQFYAQIAEVLGADIGLALQEAVAGVAERTAGGSTLTTIIGFVVLAFSASLMFFQLQHTLNSIWKVPPPSRGQTGAYVRNRLLAFGMVIGVGLFFVVATALNFLVSFVSSRIEWGGSLGVANFLTFVVMTALAFVIFYRVLPNARVSWRAIWVGALPAALLVSVGILLVKAYLNYASFGTALEAAGGVAIFLLAFYYLGQIFVFGAVLARIYASMSGAEIEPRIDESPPDSQVSKAL